MKCYFQCKNQSLLHLQSFDLVLNKYLSWQIKLPRHSFALLYTYSVELSARGRVLLALVMLQTLPDHHSHNYNVKTSIILALHLGCRIYITCVFLNVISEILCIQQDNLCCHTSRVTCTLMSVYNNDILNTNQLSSLVHTKPFPWKNKQPLHAPIITVTDISFWSDWESTFWQCTIYMQVAQLLWIMWIGVGIDWLSLGYCLLFHFGLFTSRLCQTYGWKKTNSNWIMRRLKLLVSYHHLSTWLYFDVDCVDHNNVWVLLYPIH